MFSCRYRFKNTFDNIEKDFIKQDIFLPLFRGKFCFVNGFCTKTAYEMMSFFQIAKYGVLIFRNIRNGFSNLCCFYSILFRVKSNETRSFDGLYEQDILLFLAICVVTTLVTIVIIS